MRRGGPGEDAVDPEPRGGVVQVLEQATPAAEQHRREGDLQLVDGVEVQILLDDVGARFSCVRTNTGV
jgi:hypothetical protein